MSSYKSYRNLMLTFVLSLAGTVLLLYLLSSEAQPQVVAAPAAPMQSYGVELSPGTVIATPPGSTITFTHIITNTGQSTDTFTLEAVPPQGWEHQLLYESCPPGTLCPPLTLSGGQTGTVVLILSVPLNQPSGSYTATLTATSHTSPTASASVADIVVVNPIERARLSSGGTITTPPGSTVTFTHIVTNVGQLTDTFELTVTPPTGWEFAFICNDCATGTSYLPLTLGSLQTSTLVITLEVPLNQPPGNYHAVFTAVPQSDRSSTATVTDTTVVTPIERVQLSPGTTRQADPGSVVTFTHTITNIGQLTDTFELTVTPPTGWGWSLSTAPTLTLARLQISTLVITLNIPPHTRGELYTAFITAIPASDPGARRSVSDAINVISYIYLPLVMRSYPPVPKGNIVIEGGSPTVYRLNVSLALSATVSNDTVAEMRFSNDNQSWSDWKPYSTTWSGWSLADGISGLRTVYAQFKGAKGGISSPVYDTIYLAWNGDFESGLDHWLRGQGSFNGHGTGLPQSVVSFEGSSRVLLGMTTAQDGNIPVGYGYVAQAFAVPSNARLSFKYRVVSRDTIKGTEKYYDSFEFSVNKAPWDILDADRDARGCNDPNRLNPTTTLTPSVDGLVFCGGQIVPANQLPKSWDSGWREVTIDMSAFAGRTVTLYMALWSREYQSAYWNDKAYYNTYAYVDDVRMWQQP